jgi:selenocysteine-specific elongation factor
VCDPEPATPRGRAARTRHAELVVGLGDAARSDDRAGMVRGLVALHGGLRAAHEVAASLGIGVERIEGIAGTLTFGDTVALSERLEELPGQLAGLGAHVVSADELATTLAGLGHPRDRVDDLVEHLVASGRLRRTALGLVVEQHADDAVAARELRYAAVVRRIEEHPFDPPDFRAVADEEGLDHRERVQLLASERIVRCGDVVVGQAAFEQAAVRLRALASGADGFTAAQARDALGSTRRVTVPLLEEMARRRLSTFDGRVHRMLPLSGD